MLSCLGAGVFAATSRGVPATTGHPCLVATGASDTPFVRNFNPFSDSRTFTVGGIYEPLVVVTSVGGGHEYPWLASALGWSKDGRTLTLTIRHGVTWSDGRPLTSRDVLYSLTAGRRQKVMDQIGLTRPGNHVASIDLVGSDKVAVHFKERDSTFVASVLANNVIVVPEHVFSKIQHVSRWANPNPVGSGPFAIVQRFGDEAYALGRNPHYWLKGAPHIPCIERVLGTSSDSALMQMVQGGIDVSNNFVPNASKAYVSYDPKHFHFFYPPILGPVGLYLDDTKYPYRLAAFRKAVSMAIDRYAISQFAEGGYAPPVDAIGINGVWNSWIDPAVAAEARRLAAYDPPAARRMLLAAGFTYRQGVLFDPRGNRVVIKAKVIASWSDWVTTWRVIVRNLSHIGITVDLDLVPNWGAWQPDAFSTRTATLLWGSSGTDPTPYGYFTEHLDRASFVPSGKSADLTGDWEHFQSPEGTRLLAAFRNTLDPVKQHKLAAALERVWLKTLPFIPLFAGPEWSTYSTTYFTGFPSAHDFYVEPFFDSPGYVVALTRIRSVTR